MLWTYSSLGSTSLPTCLLLLGSWGSCLGFQTPVETDKLSLQERELNWFSIGQMSRWLWPVHSWAGEGGPRGPQDAAEGPPQWVVGRTGQKLWTWLTPKHA